MSDDAADLEKLAAEVLGNWSYGYGPHAGNPPASAGSQSPQGTPPDGQRIFTWDELQFDPKWAGPLLQNKSAKLGGASGGSTQRVIPDRCKYSRRQPIPGAPKVPMSALTGERHPDLLEAAQKKIRGYVCRSYRAFPACPCTNRNVTIDYDYGYDAELGDVLVGMWLCEGCR